MGKKKSNCRKTEYQTLGALMYLIVLTPDNFHDIILHQDFLGLLGSTFQ